MARKQKSTKLYRSPQGPPFHWTLVEVPFNVPSRMRTLLPRVRRRLSSVSPYGISSRRGSR